MSVTLTITVTAKDGIDALKKEAQLSLVLKMIKELDRAERKFPGWPTDAVHATAIMMEEAGEATKAAIDYHHHRGKLKDVKAELVQTGAMALRALIHLKSYKRGSDD